MKTDLKSPPTEPAKVRRFVRPWLILLASTFVILLFAVHLRPGGPRSFPDWLLASLFLLAASAAVATALLATWRLCWWLCSWRNVKRVSVAFGGVVVFIALFYAEEDWRGWHAWNQFKQEWEAKGEHFDLASVVPPPVPDDLNFAMTDIAFTSYGHYLTREGKLIPAEEREVPDDVRMRMPLTHKRPAPANCTGDRVKGQFTQLDAWQSYYREQGAKRRDFPVPAQPRSPASDVLLALSKYDAVVDELRRANRLPCSRFPLNYDSESPFAIHLPHLAVLKSCAQALQLRSVAELQNDQADKALEDARLALQLADKVRTEPFLISHLVRVAMVQLTLQPIWEGLAGHKWSDAQLVSLEAELAKLNFPADYSRSVRSELGAQSDEMKLLRRHPERIQELQGLGDFDGNRINLPLPVGVAVHLIPAGWFYQNQHRCARMMADCYLPLADASRGTFSPDLARRGSAALAAQARSVSPYHLLERLILPPLSNAARKFAYGQASVNLARTALALERYRAAHGEFPEGLDSLAPQFIAKVPPDVIGGRPLKYRKEVDGLFLLYSIGWDETDDGGEAGFKDDGSLDIGRGDWIWRYPAKAGS